VVVVAGLMLAFRALASGQAIDATAPVRVEHVRTFGGGPLPGHLLWPSAIAVDKDGFVLVADQGFGRIQVFDRDGTLVRILGTPGRGPGEFHHPRAVATDADGDVYVAERGNNRIQVLTRTGAFVRMWGSEGSGPGQFRQPAGIAVNAEGHVYVADTYNYRIQVFASDGTFLRTWGSKGTGPGQFHDPKALDGKGPGPEGIAVDRNGIVYVTDPWNHRVQMFTSDGLYLREWSHLPGPCGQFSTPEAIGLCKRSYLNAPSGVAVDRNGNVFVVNTGLSTNLGMFYVQKFTPGGELVRVWGADGSGPGQFEMPTGVAVDEDGSFYVADRGNNRVQKFDADGRFATQWGAIGDGGLRQPTAIAVDEHGRVYVAEPTSSRIQVFTAKGDFLAMWSARKDVNYTRRLEYPDRIAADLDGRVYVQDVDRVLVFSSSGETLDAWQRDEKRRRRFDICAISADGSGQVYLVLWESRAVVALTRDGREVWRVKGLHQPFAVAADASGRVNVVEGRDTGRLRVRVLSRSGKDLGSWNVQAPSKYPKAAFDREGRLLVSDARGCTVRLFARPGTKIAEWGSCGYWDGQFQEISSITVDPVGLIYVTEYELNRVQVFRLTEAK
jgi:DNA-binding beta-propeller fold protein YncE